MMQPSSMVVWLLAVVLCVGDRWSGVWAFWRLPCPTPVTIQRLDPIVNPGGLSTHIHTVVGSAGFNIASTTSSIQTASCSSCFVQQDFSNYWIPTLYYQRHDGFLDYVPGGGFLVYYLQRRGSNASEPIFAFPDGMVIIAGNPSRRTYNASSLADRALSYSCLNFNAPATPETPGFPITNCPDGLRAQIFFPSCWDGVNVDSFDHKSHMAYPDGVNTGNCPSTHPVRLISIFYEVTFNINAFKAGWIDSNGNPTREFPFLFSTGDRTGYSLHGDFMNGWHVPTLQLAVDNCTDNSGDITLCSAFNFRPSNYSSCTLDAPIYNPNEQVFGSIWNLPGHPEVQDGAPRPASPIQLGCFQDSGQPHVLPNRLILDPTGLTPDACIAAARKANYTYAGLEYGQECWAGNTLPKPKMDGCNTYCPGATSEVEFCGGSNSLTLWQVSGGNASVGLADPPLSTLAAGKATSFLCDTHQHYVALVLLLSLLLTTQYFV